LKPKLDAEGNLQDDGNLIFGTYIDKDSSTKPDGVAKMLKRSKPRLAMKFISDCDVVIYDVHSGNPKDIELALEAFSKHPIEEEKVLILISSVAVWKCTPPNLVEIGGKQDKVEGEGEGDQDEKKDEDEKPVEEAKPEDSGDEDDVDKSRLSKLDKSHSQRPEGEGEEDEEDNEPKVVVPPKEYKNVPYTEKDFEKRVPPPEYQRIKEIEDLVLKFKKENIKIYIISAGITYGNGETDSVFSTRFKSAWL
jgi:adenylate kinase